MIRKKQIAVIFSVLVLMAVLLSMDIKGLVKPKDDRQHQNAGPAAISVPAITAASISDLARQELSANQGRQLRSLEEELAGGAPGDKLRLQKELAQKWSDVNKPGPAAFYYEMIAQQESSYESWVKAGDNFTDAYQNSTDSLIQPPLADKAISCYQRALEKKPEGLEAKTGLGVAYVSSSPNPMSGIILLKEVTAADPKNIKANMNLGLFSMKSGQFEKAVERFKTVLSVQPGPEAWFYLASSYENLGKNKDAVTAYKKSKELAADPGLSKFVDQRIVELNK